MNSYDSTADTLLHIKRVAQLLTEASAELIRRANIHDDSKLKSPEKELFDKFTPKLKDCTYGSDEYKGFLKELKPALDHHYLKNPHHPEHYPNGIYGMDLFDILEMVLDWKSASERHADGDIYKSIQINKKRFAMDPQLVQIFINTATRLGWVPNKDVPIALLAGGIPQAHYLIEGDVLFLKMRTTKFTEENIIGTISSMEKKKFKHVAYLNIE